MPVRPRPALEVPIVAETDLEAVLDTLAAERPEACVIDSVQTLRSGELSGAPGSVGQVREVAARIMELAKAQGIAVILVGHVTKDGALAGPRVLEHLVDCVLQFEGERERPYRELRALKNRFGSTNEAGLFEMRQGGLVEVLDASARFVAEATRAPGSVVLATMEGSRPAARRGAGARRAARSSSSRAASSPASTATASRWCWRSSRATAASATGGCDVFVNVVGGVRVDEPGCDLAVALAVASAARGGAGRPTARRRAARLLRRARPDRASCAGSGTPSGAWTRRRGTACATVIAPPESDARARDRADAARGARAGPARRRARAAHRRLAGYAVAWRGARLRAPRSALSSGFQRSGAGAENSLNALELGLWHHDPAKM